VLGVETVLEGSLRRAGSRLRISVQLINVADGFHLWSERYDREMADVFVVQDEITRAITGALMPKLVRERPAMLVKPYTGSVDAYELCLRARYHHQRRTPDGLGMAFRLFEQAAARDPNCATAHAGLAHVCLLLCYFGGLPTSVGMPRMKSAALRALELDDTLAITHVRMADALCFKDWDWAGAEREFQRALELDPESAEALWRYGLFLWARQRHAEALVRLRNALVLDPFSLDANWLLGWVCISTGRLDEAEELARKMLAMDPNLWLGYHLIGWLESARGRWDEATRANERMASIEGGPATLAVLCSCYTRAGRPAEAQQALERLEQMTTTRIVPPTWLALAYDGVGAEAQARACMELAIEERHMLLVHLRGFMASTGMLSSYRSLLDELGL
jgi:serine/threonine-protein kinase